MGRLYAMVQEDENLEYFWSREKEGILKMLEKKTQVLSLQAYLIQQSLLKY